MNLKHLMLLFLVIPSISKAAPDTKIKTFSLQEAIQQKIIVLSSIQSVAYQSLQLRLKNVHQRKDIYVYFPTGLQFASRDSSEQDQIILQERTLLVKAGRTISPTFVSYCTQSNHRSPGKESQFDLKENANGKLLELASFLSTIKDINYTAQHAVWTVTNDHDLKGLHHDDLKTAIKIQKFVADLTGKPLPKYTVRYKDGRERQVAFTGEAIVIYGHHEYILKEDATVTCQIFNEAGEMVQQVFKDMTQKGGKIRFNFKLKALDLPQGKYVSKVFIEGKTIQEQWVEA
ncbi:MULTISPECIES: hypothetical protein [unclassified Aureispira]|uniref:hypothetical protein n=1 Tax=unclassified Aureispira TaxID=2649989 RepID=UPI000698C10B|nr:MULTISPECIES: hypothetical protein [unclassified Aureispira]WMX17237.1 hypothetical protein QP953_12715 [Aureispira sp. CCB-E]